MTPAPPNGKLPQVEITAPEGQLREAYVPNRRVRLASDVAGLCAVLLLLGLLGAAFTWWGRSALFDLASNSRETVKIDPGFLVGPALILITVPLVIGRARQLALKRLFRTRIAIAALLWVAGLAALIAKIGSLDSSYAIEAGTYVSAALMVVGFASTLAMWPAGLPVVQVNRKGILREPTAAAAPR
jgi:undecaprenyl pyrophosphate phosphatase UppP